MSSPTVCYEKADSLTSDPSSKVEVTERRNQKKVKKSNTFSIKPTIIVSSDSTNNMNGEILAQLQCNKMKANDNDDNSKKCYEATKKRSKSFTFRKRKVSSEKKEQMRPIANTRTMKLTMIDVNESFSPARSPNVNINNNHKSDTKNSSCFDKSKHSHDKCTTPTKNKQLKKIFRTKTSKSQEDLVDVTKAKSRNIFDDTKSKIEKDKGVRPPCR